MRVTKEYKGLLVTIEITYNNFRIVEIIDEEDVFFVAPQELYEFFYSNLKKYHYTKYLKAVQKADRLAQLATVAGESTTDRAEQLFNFKF